MFRTFHAGALFTFAETTGGIAVFSLFGPKDRAVAANITVDVSPSYNHKKKRYRLSEIHKDLVLTPHILSPLQPFCSNSL